MFRVERTDTGLLVAPEGRLDSAAAEDFSEACWPASRKSTKPWSSTWPR